MITGRSLVVAAALVVTLACSSCQFFGGGEEFDEPESASTNTTRPASTAVPGHERRDVIKIELRSSAFKDGGSIPKKNSCGDDEVSPPLSWSKVPGAKSYALIMDDPDAPGGTFDHWIVFGIPAEVTSLEEGASQSGKLPEGSKEGSVAGSTGYIGPCPPPGPAHRYVFRLYALDLEAELSEGAMRDQLEGAIKGHVLGQGTLTGRFGRD